MTVADVSAHLCPQNTACQATCPSTYSALWTGTGCRGRLPTRPPRTPSWGRRRRGSAARAPAPEPHPWPGPGVVCPPAQRRGSSRLAVGAAVERGSWPLIGGRLRQLEADWRTIGPQEWSTNGRGFDMTRRHGYRVPAATVVVSAVAPELVRCSSLRSTDAPQRCCQWWCRCIGYASRARLSP